MAVNRTFAALLMMMILCLHGAHADQIVLKNGDRLTGKVVSKDEKTLTYRTEYAGVIKVQWKDVVSITTEEPVTVMSANGQLEKVRLEHAGAGAAKLVSGGKSRDVPLADLAHINPPPHVSGTGVTYRGRVKFLASASRGNTVDDGVYLEAALAARAKPYRWGIDFRGERTSEAGVTTAENSLFNANYDRFLDKDRFAYARASAERDQFKDIKFRGTVGAGLGWQVFDTEKIHLDLRAGLDYVTTSRDSVDPRIGDSKNYPALGWGINYSHWIWPDRLQLFHEQQGFMNLNDTSDITLRTKTGARLPIGGGLSADAQVNWDYDADVPPDTSKSDTKFLLGLGYEF